MASDHNPARSIVLAGLRSLICLTQQLASEGGSWVLERSIEVAGRPLMSSLPKRHDEFISGEQSANRHPLRHFEKKYLFSSHIATGSRIPSEWLSVSANGMALGVVRSLNCCVRCGREFGSLNFPFV
jgi:hypothetical protein